MGLVITGARPATDAPVEASVQPVQGARPATNAPVEASVQPVHVVQATSLAATVYAEPVQAEVVYPSSQPSDDTASPLVTVQAVVLDPE